MLDHPLVVAAAPALIAAVVLVWRWAAANVAARRQWRDDVHRACTVELPNLRTDLVTHMGNEEQLRRDDQHERERRQAVIDGQFATLRQEFADGMRSVHERIDDVLVRVARPSNGGWQGPRRG